MIRRFAAASAACLILAAPVVGAGSAARGAPPPSTGVVNLLGDPDFDGSGGAPVGWTCDDAVHTGFSVPGSEFIQMPLTDPEVPDLPATAARAGTSLAAAAPGTGVTAVPIEATQLFTWLVGSPTADAAAGCAQEVPVRGGSTYTLSLQVSGEVFLGTEYGEVSTRADTSVSTLTTTFTTAPHADRVRVWIHGRRGGHEYQAAHAALVGPPSRTRLCAAPTGLGYVSATSWWIRLQWTATAGASGYEVRLGGVTVGRVAGTAALVRGLAPGSQYTFSVVGLNDAGRSAPSATATAWTSQGYPAAPDAPEWDTVEVSSNGDGTGIARLDFWADTATDGYFLYLDGVRIGWLLGPPAQVPVLPAGQHTLQLGALNSAGESPLSEPYPIQVDTTG